MIKSDHALRMANIFDYENASHNCKSVSGVLFQIELFKPTVWVMFVKRLLRLDSIVYYIWIILNARVFALSLIHIYKIQEIS